MVMGVFVKDARVNPYGLVAKAGVWYLVAEGEGRMMRVYRIAHLTGVQAVSDIFDRRADFDLAQVWQQWSANYERSQHRYPVRLRLSPEILPYAPLYFGHNILNRITREGPPDADGWVTLTIPFELFQEARGRILSLGGAVEVLEPDALRCGVADFAQQTLKRCSPAN